MRLGLSKNRSRYLPLVAMLVTLIFTVILFCAMLVKLQPYFIEYSKVYANNLANEIVNNAINNTFSDSKYESFTNVNESSSNAINTIETNSAKINRLKSEIINEIQENIKLKKFETVYIPLGSCSGFYFLAGLGPKIQIRIYPVSVVNAKLKDDFESVGINQVKHKMYIDVSLQMSYVGILCSKSEEIHTSILVNETIIVGDTPNYYGNGGVSAKID